MDVCKPGLNNPTSSAQHHTARQVQAYLRHVSLVFEPLQQPSRQHSRSHILTSRTSSKQHVCMQTKRRHVPHGDVITFSADDSSCHNKEQTICGVQEPLVSAPVTAPTCAADQPKTKTQHYLS